MTSIPFLNQLALAQTEAEFARTAAGFTALQVYDSIKCEGYDASIHRDVLQRLARDVAGIDPESGVRAALDSVIEVLPFWDADDTTVRIGRRAIFSALLNYGQALGDEGEWIIAEHVYDLTGADAEMSSELWLAAEARLLMGRASRMNAKWDHSRVAYRRAYQLGVESGDMSIALRAQIGDANNLWNRGDFPTAKRRLAAIARQATESCPSVLPRVTLAQAGVANAAGEYEHAIHIAFELLDSLPDGDDLRHQTLVDLAIFLTDSGLPSVAATALHIVEGTAPEPRVRRQAKLNLFFLVAQHGDEATFDTAHQELTKERLTAREQTQHALFAAQGYRRFARWDAAQSAVERAVRLATQFQFFQLVFEAESELRELEIARSASRFTRETMSASKGESHMRHASAAEKPTNTTKASSPIAGKLSPRMRHVVESLTSMAAAVESSAVSVL